jgi:hypothetical protein
MAKNALTAERLRELLDYDPETGVFTWKVRTGCRVRIGQQAGSLRVDGYVFIGLDGGKHLAHRLAWLHVHGEWPPVEIDHVSGVKSQNQLSNLRLATRSQNQRNVGRISTNTSGFKGVTLDGKAGPRKPWLAQIKFGRRSVYLGNYATPEGAHAAYCEAAREHHGEFSRAE